MGDDKFKKCGSVSIRLIEEMSELTKEICKLERFGFNNYNPFDTDRKPNWMRVIEEMQDVKALLEEYSQWVDDQLPNFRANGGVDGYSRD